MHSPNDSTQRTIPSQNWPRALTAALVLCGLATAGWEARARSMGYPNGYYADSDDLWGLTRRGASQAEKPLAIVGSSRVLFDVDLDTWEEVTGQRPIQLALEGTDPRPFLADLANDPEFDGSVLVGVTDLLLFSGYRFRGELAEGYKKQTPAERASQRISMLLEPLFAFYGSGGFAMPLFTQLKWIPMTNRPGVIDPAMEVRDLALYDADRNTRMWERVWEDPAMNQATKDRWMYLLNGLPKPPPGTPPLDPQPVFDEIRTNIEKIRSRGGDVAFLRCPSIPPFADIEQSAFPRAGYWDLLSAGVNAGTVHFQDNPSLQGFDLPEWSHIHAGQRGKFTRAVIPLIEQAFESRKPVVTLPAEVPQQ